MHWTTWDVNILDVLSKKKYFQASLSMLCRIFEPATPRCLCDGTGVVLPAGAPRYWEACGGVGRVQLDTPLIARGPLRADYRRKASKKEVSLNIHPFPTNRFVYFWGSVQGVSLTLLFLIAQDPHGAERRRGKDATREPGPWRGLGRGRAGTTCSQRVKPH